jgi:hypothetical protein
VHEHVGYCVAPDEALNKPVDSVVALFVPVYASFWYLTDFWIVSLPVLGFAILWAFKKLE